MKPEHLLANLISRIMIFVLFASVLTLTHPDVRNLMANNQTQLAYSLLLEVLSIIAILCQPRSAINENFIDISVYISIFLSIVLASYFTKDKTYDFIVSYLYTPLLLSACLISIVRMCWMVRRDGAWIAPDWPAIGFIGWTSKIKPLSPPSFDDKCYIYFAITCCFLIAFGIAGQDGGIIRIIVGSIGLGSVCIYGAAAQNHLISIQKNLNDYRSMVLAAASGPIESPNNDKPIRIVVNNSDSKN